MSVWEVFNVLTTPNLSPAPTSAKLSSGNFATSPSTPPVSTRCRARLAPRMQFGLNLLFYNFFYQALPGISEKSGALLFCAASLDALSPRVLASLAAADDPPSVIRITVDTRPRRPHCVLRRQRWPTPQLDGSRQAAVIFREILRPSAAPRRYPPPPSLLARIPLFPRLSRFKFRQPLAPYSPPYCPLSHRPRHRSGRLRQFIISRPPKWVRSWL